MPTDPAAANAGTLAAGEPASVAARNAARVDESAVVESEASIGATLGTRVAVDAIAAIVVVAGLWAGKALLMPVAFAIVLALLLTPPVGLLNRFGLPPWFGAAITMTLAIALVGAGVLQLSGPAEQWLNPRSPEWRKLETQLRAIKQPLSKLQGAQERVSEIAEPEGKARAREVVVQKDDLFTTFGRFQAIAFGATSTIVLAYFLLAAGDLFLRKLIRVLPTMQDKRRAVGIARTIQSEIGRYFATVAMSNTGLAVATALVMGYIGMPSPAFWGTVVGLLNFVPYLGAATSLVLLTAAAAVTLEGWQIAQVPLAFLVLTTIEGQFVQPVLVGRRMQLNVVVTFLAVLFGGWLWGLGGLFIAVPTLVVLKICADHIESLSTIGEFISRD